GRTAEPPAAPRASSRPAPPNRARPAPRSSARPGALPPAHAAILAAIPEHDPISFEMLLQSTGLAAGELSAALIVLEVRRQVKRLPGPEYERA
ncbi:MAG: hypothetical protein ACREJ2_15315, partial [Planctomycetota bacterium]